MITHIAFTIFRNMARAWMFVESQVVWLLDWWEGYVTPKINSYLVRSDGVQFQENHTHVPKDCIYIEEVAPRKYRVLYEDDEITPYDRDPYEKVHVPWLWIGDVHSNTILTDAVRRYLVPGNFIMIDLLVHLLGEETEADGFMYMDPNTMDLRKFPVEGIRLETQDDPVSSS